jgi:hypothetical protein
MNFYEKNPSSLKLYYTEPVQPDINIPADILVNGYSFNEYRDHHMVYKSCSTKFKHGEGWDKANCHGGIKQFSTKKLAYQALMHALELKLIKQLEKIRNLMETDI